MRIPSILALLTLLVSAPPARAGDAEDVLAALEAREPSVGELRAAALQHAGLAGRSWRGWARRARLAAVLPTLTLRAGRQQASDRDLTRQSSGDERLGVSRDRDQYLEARATWDLDRLVFDSDEIRAARTGQRLHRERLALAAQVTALYFQRRKLQIEIALGPPASAHAAALRQLELAELTAQLDALTGGFLSRSRRN